jgi:hypothetical protein
MKRSLTTLTMILVIGSLPALGQIGGTPGAFSRMGFGARGMAMGNAMSAVVWGPDASYYNPALTAWTESITGDLSVGLLSLDRSLNFVRVAVPVRPRAGVSFTIINSGVSNIDGRDADGLPTGNLKTSENQAALSFGIRLSEKVSAGLSFKFYYYHLYTDMNSTTVGVDVGILYRIAPSLTVAGTIRDIKSKYKWDSSKLFGTSGNTSDDLFPMLYGIGSAYKILDSLAIVSVEVQFSDQSTTIIRGGVEVPIVPEFTLRAGVDRMDIQNKGMGVVPAFGFTARTSLDGWAPALHYAFAVEPFAPRGYHMITLEIGF